jgi:hypothetical protein
MRLRRVVDRLRQAWAKAAEALAKTPVPATPRPVKKGRLRPGEATPQRQRA